VVDAVGARWRREDLLDKSPLALHAAAAAFAFVALVLVASNQHGDWMQFDRYQEYRCVRDPIRVCLPPSSIRASPYVCCAVLARYLLAIAALAFAYSLAQALRHAHRMRSGADPVSAPSWRIFDFVADQASCFALFLSYSSLIITPLDLLDSSCSFNPSIWTNVCWSVWGKWGTVQRDKVWVKFPMLK
jgi:hypothetical protein